MKNVWISDSEEGQQSFTTITQDDTNKILYDSGVYLDTAVLPEQLSKQINGCPI